MNETSSHPRPAAESALRILEATRELSAVCTALIDREGRVLDANLGFRRVLEGAGEDPEDVRDLFLNPRFAQFAALRPSAPQAVLYEGLLTLGDVGGGVLSLRGRICAHDGALLLVAEHDVEALDRLSEAVLALNEAIERKHRELTRLNRSLQRDRAELERHAGLLAQIEQTVRDFSAKRELRATLSQATPRLAQISPRERQVLDLLVEGRTHKEIARALGISERTVASHRENIMHKTGAQSLPELVRLHMLA